jgi:hypothetical protein
VPNDFDSEDAVKTAYHRHRLPVEGRRQVFRIGQAGHMNEAMILQALAGCEMATRDVGIRLAAGSGVAAAEEHSVPPRRIGGSLTGRVIARSGATRENLRLGSKGQSKDISLSA